MFGNPIGGDIGGVEPNRGDLPSIYLIPYREFVAVPGLPASEAEADAANLEFLTEWID